MGDAELRGLERRAAQDPRAWLQVARAYERRGDPARALEALWRGCDDDAGLRRAAAQVEPRQAPIRSARLAWETRPDPRRDPSLTVHPLAVLFHLSNKTVLADPRTGERRVDLHPVVGGFLGEVYLSGERELVGVDAWTGEVLHATALPGSWAPRVVGGDLFLTTSRGHVIAWRFSDPRRKPEEAWRWKSDLGRFSFGFVVPEHGLVVLHDFWRESSRSWETVVVALDAATGAERFRHPGGWPRVVEGRLVVSPAHHRAGRKGKVTTLSLDGRVLEERPLKAVARHADEIDGLRFETSVMTLEPADVVSCHDAAGELWRWRPAKQWMTSGRPTVRFLPGRVYVWGGRHVACLVADDAAEEPRPPLSKTRRPRPPKTAPR